MDVFNDDVFSRAVRLLPDELRLSTSKLDLCAKTAAEEIRMRMGQPLTALFHDGEREISDVYVSKWHIDHVIDAATGASSYSSVNSMRAGYLTVRGGFRIGLCGSVILRDGRPEGFRVISSLSIRLPRQITGLAEILASDLWQLGKLQSTLIVSPPGSGKTTLLRDIIRTASYGDRELHIVPQRVSLCDERSEIAALCGGIPAMDVGPRTDVLDACPRAEGIMMLLRAMSPEIIAFDEITAPQDAEAAEAASKCGVTLLATAHGTDISDISGKDMYRRLLKNGVFSRVVFIRRIGVLRKYSVFSAGEVMRRD